MILLQTRAPIIAALSRLPLRVLGLREGGSVRSLGPGGPRAFDFLEVRVRVALYLRLSVGFVRGGHGGGWGCFLEAEGLWEVIQS